MTSYSNKSSFPSTSFFFSYQNHYVDVAAAHKEEKKTFPKKKLWIESIVVDKTKQPVNPKRHFEPDLERINREKVTSKKKATTLLFFFGSSLNKQSK